MTDYQYRLSLCARALKLLGVDRLDVEVKSDCYPEFIITDGRMVRSFPDLESLESYVEDGLAHRPKPSFTGRTAQRRVNVKRELRMTRYNNRTIGMRSAV